MDVIIYSFNLNISPKMSYGMLKCDYCYVTDYMLMICHKRFCNKKALFELDPVFFSIM